MGFLERAIRRGISEGVGRAVGDVVKKAVEPKATELANKAAQHIDQAAQNNQQQTRTFTGLEGAFANLERAAQGYATEMSKNMKVCSACGQATTADKKFCPNCGNQLPDVTMADSAVCPNCGKQNDLGTKFCQDCGTKLPVAVQEEQAAAAREAAVMEQWDKMLAAYPKWNCGGEPGLAEYGDHIRFWADFKGNGFAAKAAVEQYRQILRQAGFRPAGQYPSEQQLYRKESGICYHVDLEHCFDGDSDCPNLYFDRSEPSGGFDYVKPESRKPAGLKDLFKF